MKSNFWNKQEQFRKDKYINLLCKLGMLSGLFSESSVPYLYYRVHEKLFCDIFDANDLSRGDISFDAMKGELGIGLKTFLHGNGKTFQKIAEFNASSDMIRAIKDDKELVHFVSELRNKRLEITLNQTNTTEMLYSLVTRSEGYFHISEVPMHLIDIKNIKNIKPKGNTVAFSDGLHDYTFSKLKSTLLKRFVIDSSHILESAKITILENPFDILEQLKFEHGIKLEDDGKYDVIYLPLYSARSGQVEEKSGLNQWNASGRKRHENEVYIPIPSFIHKDFPTFFNYTNSETPPFTVKLPSGEEISCKVCQSGGKALMSNPNEKLGEWILRHVLQLPVGTLVTREILDTLEIDSIKLTKESENAYFLDFAKSGSFDEFRDNIEK